MHSSARSYTGLIVAEIMFDAQVFGIHDLVLEHAADDFVEKLHMLR
jgi:hypothetical protein